MESGQETESLRCMFSKGIDVSFPSEIRQRRRPSCEKEVEVSSFQQSLGQVESFDYVCVK